MANEHILASKTPRDVAAALRRIMMGQSLYSDDQKMAAALAELLEADSRSDAPMGAPRKGDALLSVEVTSSPEPSSVELQALRDDVQRLQRMVTERDSQLGDVRAELQNERAARLALEETKPEGKSKK